MTPGKARLAYSLAGAVAFAAAQAVLFLIAGQPAGRSIDDAGWFLNSTSGIATMALVMAVGAVAAGRILPPRGIWQVWAAFTAGSAVALVVAVFAFGPGTIFPLVIAAGIAVAGVGGLAGLLAARLLLR